MTLVGVNFIQPKTLLFKLIERNIALKEIRELLIVKSNLAKLISCQRNITVLLIKLAAKWPNAHIEK